MRVILISSLLFAACTSSPGDAPYTPAEAAGTWTGTATNNKTTRYTFGADGSFSYSLESDGVFQPFLSGSFTFADRDLVLRTQFPNDDGTQEPLELQSTAYVGPTQFCDFAFRPDPTNDGLFGTWSGLSSSQLLDANGAAVGTPAAQTTTISFSNDGTMQAGTGPLGTYTIDGDRVTTTVVHGNFADVRTYTFVDGAVLCDPAYTH